MRQILTRRFRLYAYGRQHRSADSNPEMVEKMAARYRHAAELHWSATLAEIERVKRLYQTKIKKSKK
ncbi:hypothetical protein CDN31_004128 [Escherichia coli]|nr:hypothetical protein [Escherichia coli]